MKQQQKVRNLRPQLYTSVSVYPVSTIGNILEIYPITWTTSFKTHEKQIKEKKKIIISENEKTKMLNNVTAGVKPVHFCLQKRTDF